jgi:hypothetical protein
MLYKEERIKQSKDTLLPLIIVSLSPTPHSTSTHLFVFTKKLSVLGNQGFQCQT